MKALSADIGLQLSWTQPSALERYFELYSDNILLEKLSIEPGWTATGELTIPALATERWTLKSNGILKKARMTIRDAGTDEILAVYFPKFWGGGRVEFVNGRSFSWESISFWATGRGFFNERQERIFVLNRKQLDLLKVQSTVKIEAPYRDLPELPILLMLACYLSVQNSYANR